MVTTLSALLFALCLAGTAQAEQVAPQAASPAAPCHLLEDDGRQPKAGQLSVGAFGGSLLGASVGGSYAAGARATYFVSRLIGLGLSYANSRLADGHDLPATAEREIHLINGLLELAVDTTVRLSSKTVLEVDLFGTFGGGALRLGGQWDGMGVIGGGVRAFTGLRWLAVRIDVTNYLHRTRRQDGTRFESTTAFTLGLSFLLPPRSPRLR